MREEVDTLILRDLTQLSEVERRKLQRVVLDSKAVCELFSDIVTDLRSIFGFTTEDKQNVEDAFSAIRILMRWYKSHLGHMTILPICCSGILYIINSLGFNTSGFAHAASLLFKHWFHYT